MRKLWCIEEDQGPVDVGERRSEKAMYTGGARRFKFYSYRVFCVELQSLQRDVTPQTASERQFMEALRLSSARLSNHLAVRNMPESFTYRGPQSVAHRVDLERLLFEPRQVHPVGVRRALRRVADFPCLLCSDCGSWRRVDDATLLVYSNETYFDDHIAALRREFLAVDAAVLSDLLQHVRRQSGSIGRVSLEHFWTGTELRRRLWGERAADCVVLAVHECLLLESPEVAPELLSAYRDHWASLPGPKFRCAMLVDGACEEPCDWSRAVECAHDFSGLRSFSHDPVLLLDPESETVLKAEFRRHAVEGVRQERCVVQGCDACFPARHPHGWCFTRRSRTSEQESYPGFCKLHYQRLRRLQKRRDYVGVSRILSGLRSF